MEEPVLEYEALTVGQQFPAIPCPLTDTFVDAYIEATGEAHPLFARCGSGSAYAPPLCTSLVRFVKGSLGGRWPTGTVHLSQEVRLLRPMRRGETLTLEVEVGQKYTRHLRRYIELITTTRDVERQPVARGVMLMLWAGAAEEQTGQAPGPGTSCTPPKQEPVPPTTGEPLTPITAGFPRAKLEVYGDLAAARDAIHLDPAYAARSRFGRNIAQGLLLLTLLSRLMTQSCAERWLATGCLMVRFVKPAFVDDRITARGVRLKETPTAYAIWCENQHGAAVITGRATV